jgi:hypothetical protein
LRDPEAGVLEIETDPPRSFLGVMGVPAGVTGADRPDEAVAGKPENIDGKVKAWTIKLFDLCYEIATLVGCSVLHKMFVT